jgi:hypothetical protein
MRSLSIFLTVTYLACGTSSSQAIDLTKVPRTISKEPAYQSDPRYIFLVFGPQAKFRLWLAFDGDLVYVDRNGNGDLTEPRERLKPSQKPTDDTFIRCTVYDLGALEDPFTGKKYDKVRIDRLALKADYVPKAAKEKERIRSLQKNGTLARISIWQDGKIIQTGHASCASHPAKANILHFDGPLTFHLVDGGVLKRGDKPADLRVELGTPGLGRQVYHCTSFAVAPKDVHPVAEIEFPSKKPNGQPIKRKYTLTGRC